MATDLEDGVGSGGDLVGGRRLGLAATIALTQQLQHLYTHKREKSQLSRLCE